MSNNGYVGSGRYITKDMIILAANAHDTEFIGSICLEALGIDAICDGFAICKNDPFRHTYDDGNHVNIFWTFDGSVLHNGTFCIDDIMRKLEDFDFYMKKAE